MKLQNLKRQLFRKYIKYEKYLVWIFSTWIFAAVLMWLAKRIFSIYLPFSSWNAFLQTIGVLSFLVAVLSAWLNWSGEKRSSIQVAAARKEEQVTAILEKHEHMLLQHEEKERNFGLLVTRIQEELDELRSLVGRLSAQVQQSEAEAIMQRKLTSIERRLALLDSKE